MAAVTLLGVATWNTTTGTHTVTATPAVNDLIVIVCANSGITAAPTVTDDNASGTYTQDTDAACLARTSGDSGFIFVRNALVGSAVSTIFSVTGASSTGGGLVVLKVTGMTRTGMYAVRAGAHQDNQATTTTPAPVLNDIVLTANPVIGYVLNATNAAALTPRSSPAYTELADLGYNSPATGLEVMVINSGETAATITWGGTSPSAFGSGVVELDTSALPQLESTPPTQQPSFRRYREDWIQI